MPTTNEIIAFCKEKIPEAIPLFEYIREKEPAEDYLRVLEEAGERLEIYEEVLEEEGPEMAELYLLEVRMELRVDEQIYRWHSTKAEGGDTTPIEKNLRMKLFEQVELEIRSGRAELAALKEEVSELEADLKEMEKTKTRLVDERLAEILDEDEDE
ncbi:MAG: hypothetical protein AAF591_23240, partial [Verrucomicrobiota bacterium]